MITFRPPEQGFRYNFYRQNVTNLSFFDVRHRRANGGSRLVTVKRSRPTIAVLLFSTLFVLSQDYWTWTDPVSLSLFGLPPWVYQFVALQIGVSVVVWWLGREDSTSKDDR